MTQKYYVESRNTKFHLVTNNELVDEHVTTSKGPFDEHSILTFSQAVKLGPVTATITGPKGLYVALPKSAGEDTKLIWSEDKYEWTISHKVGSHPPSYVIYPPDRDGLYWVDKSGNGNVVVLERKHIKFQQNFWFLTKA